MINRIAALLLVGTACTLGACSSVGVPVASLPPAGQKQTHPLLAGFQDPPNEARPRVWWHWMHGNVTKDGIAKDLAWMKQVGIGGFQNFDANLDTPQVVDEPLRYMTPEWKDAFRFAASEAARLDLEMAIAASPGWSETGGPWVPPEDGVKKVVWGETRLAGGERFNAAIERAPTVTGPYQTMHAQDALAALQGGEAPPPPTASGHIAVLAVPIEAPVLPKPVFTLAGGQEVDPDPLLDDDLESGFALPVTPEHTGMIYATYPAPVNVRTLDLAIPGLVRPFRSSPIVPILEAKIDGEWRELATTELTSTPGTYTFEPLTAREFRLRITDNKNVVAPTEMDGVPGAMVVDFFALGDFSTIALNDFRLSGEHRIGRAQEKAGFAGVYDYYDIMSRDPTPVGFGPGEVIDLTDRVDATGTLDWTPPAGRDWLVLDLGWSLIGTTNHPASPEATGLEVDKYDAAAVRRYLEHYLGMYRETVGDDFMGEKGLRALLTDSIETGFANWTPAMEQEFARRRGYALRPWLPTLAGIVIGSEAETEKFLYDWRLTLAELLTDNHYGTVAKVAHENGLKVYGEALEDKRPMLGDDLSMRRYTDVPMAAMWTWPKGGSVRTTLLGDMQGAASTAHVYGQRFVAAESMTSASSPWAFAPRDLKTFIDLEFASGINLPVIHTSVHQPRDDLQPGLSLAIFGQYFNRHDTWAAMARPWVDYMARTAWLLQQGHYHADIAWFIGEESPVTAQFATSVPEGLPTAYGYDFINAGMLRDALMVDGKELVTRSGTRYSILHLGGTSRFMTLAALRRVAEIAEAGVLVSGAKPQASPALEDDAAQFAALADRVWSLGNVVATSDPERVLASHGIAADFAITKGSDVKVLHRALGDGEVYFLSNRSGRPQAIEAAFRVSGKAPELWDPVTTETSALSYRTEGEVTHVPIDLTDNGSALVVFRKPSPAISMDVPKPAVRPVDVAFAPWQVEFQPGRGAPAETTMDHLAPLNESTDPGIRYFSGVATYRSSFTVPAGTEPGDLTIDLGKIGDVAEVYVNGSYTGTALFSPNTVAIGRFAKAGPNTIEVRVANLWVNRLIGDKQPGATPITFTAAPTYLPDAPLRPAGLIGPVRLLETK